MVNLRSLKGMWKIRTIPCNQLLSEIKATHVVWDPLLASLLVKPDRDRNEQRVWELISEAPDQSGTGVSRRFSRAAFGSNA